MTDIQIPDEPRSAAQPSEPESTSPYRNLLVPLVVVPAAVIMVLVLIFTLFGAIAGKEATPRQNVDRLLEGGANERQQAAFNLVRQVIETWQAEAEHRAGEWDLDDSLRPRLRAAWEDTRDVEEAGDVPIPLALSIILAHMGDSEAVAALASMTQLGEELDPEGTYRSYASFALGSMGEDLSEPDRIVAARAMIALLDDPDPGLRSVGVIALQTLPTPETLPALRGALGAGLLEVRLNAALSLARLHDASGEAVLLEAVGLEPYREEHARQREKWAKEVRVSESRQKALEALIDLGRAPSRDFLQRIADADEDPLVREIAMRALAANGE